MLVASCLPTRFVLQNCFSVLEFRAKFEVVLYKNNFYQSLRITRNHTFFFTVNWVAESEEIRYMYSTEILLNTATIREVNSTAIDFFFA